MIGVYAWLIFTVFTVAVILATWDTWRTIKPNQPDEWISEDDPRREPNWRRI